MQSQPELEELQPEIEFTPDKALLQAAFSQTVARALPTASITLAIIYAGLTIGHGALLDPIVSIVLLPLAALSALFFLAMFWLTRSDAFSDEYAQFLAGFFGIIGLTNSLLHLALTQDPLQSSNLMILFLACGSLFLSWFWFGLVAVLGSLGWVFVFLIAPQEGSWVHFGIGIVMSLILAAGLQHLRLRAYKHTFTLRQQNDKQRWFLEQQQVTLEERVIERTDELAQLNDELKAEVNRRREIERQLKRNQDGLKRDRNNLEKEVSKRTVELRNANAQLKQAMTLRDAFLANMSHELRTPLNSILGNSEILQENLYGPLNERQSSAVGRIDSSGRHLLNLINDVLDVSKIGAGKLKLSLAPVNVSSLCRSALNMVRTEATRKQVELSLILDPSVKMIIVDGRRIKQVLVNLLSNAVKFTPEGGRVGLIVRGRTDIQQVHLMVWDTGIGIEDSQASKLFKPFVQLDSGLAKEHEGTGLGLSLSSQLVELHSGAIGVKSQVGKGSLFVVSLPWAMETRIEWGPNGSKEASTDADEKTVLQTQDDSLLTLPIDGEPTEIVEWVTQSPDAQSPLEPQGTAD